MTSQKNQNLTEVQSQPEKRYFEEIAIREAAVI